ncbi:hypothetical protein HpDR94a_14840 [Helicobacter pylori]
MVCREYFQKKMALEQLLKREKVLVGRKRGAMVLAERKKNPFASEKKH